MTTIEGTMDLTLEKHGLQVAPMNTPMALLSAAVARGVDTEQLTKLMELQERWEKNEARKAFADAMVRFKAIPIEIKKNKNVGFDTSKGRTEYSHATLDNVCRQIIVGLQSVGIAHSWRPETKDNKVTVTCVLRHQLGHEDSVTLDGPPDTSGTKNPIQALASTITYLERYSLLAATGLAVGMPDDDGKACDVATIEPDANGKASLESCGSLNALQVAWKALTAEQRKTLNTIKEECKARIQEADKAAA